VASSLPVLFESQEAVRVAILSFSRSILLSKVLQPSRYFVCRMLRCLTFVQPSRYFVCGKLRCLTFPRSPAADRHCNLENLCVCVEACATCVVLPYVSPASAVLVVVLKIDQAFLGQSSDVTVPDLCPVRYHFLSRCPFRYLVLALLDRNEPRCPSSPFLAVVRKTCCHIWGGGGMAIPVTSPFLLSFPLRFPFCFFFVHSESP